MSGDEDGRCSSGLRAAAREEQDRLDGAWSAKAQRSCFRLLGQGNGPLCSALRVKTNPKRCALSSL